LFVKKITIKANLVILDQPRFLVNQFFRIASVLKQRKKGS
jgi:hypothetical protein